MSNIQIEPNPVEAATAFAPGARAPSDTPAPLLPGATTVDGALEAASLLQQAIDPEAHDGFDGCVPLLDAFPHPAFVADEDGDLRRANARLLALVDATQATVRGVGWLDTLHVDDRPLAAAQWRASVGSGLSFLARVRLRLGDGSDRWHSASAKRFLVQPERWGWLTTFTDIDDQVRAEKGRLASQRRFEATLVHAPVGVAYTATSGRFTYANGEFCRLVGYTADELRQLTWQAITHPDDVNADQALAQAVLEGRSPFYLMDKRYVRKDGQPLYIRLFGNFIRNDRGEVVEGLAVVLDLSDLRRAERRQLEATQRRDEFLRMLAHELRNPLGPIRNGAALLKRHPGDAQVVARAGQIIERQSAHLASLLDSLLDVARITRGRIRLQRRACDLQEIVDQVMQDQADQAIEQGLTLRRLPGAGDLALDADPVRVAQAVTNLVANAIRFTNSGSVSVRCERDGDMAVCRVQDTGCGMDEDTQARLFEPFSQAEQGIERALGGLGVGLMIVKAIAELHGGKATGTSAGPGKGSTFELHLPSRPPEHGR